MENEKLFEDIPLVEIEKKAGKRLIEIYRQNINEDIKDIDEIVNQINNFYRVPTKNGLLIKDEIMDEMILNDVKNTWEVKKSIAKLNYFMRNRCCIVYWADIFELINIDGIKVAQLLIDKCKELMNSYSFISEEFDRIHAQWIKQNDAEVEKMIKQESEKLKKDMESNKSLEQ